MPPSGAAVSSAGSPAALLEQFVPVAVEGGHDAGAAVGRVQVPQVVALQRVPPAAERHRLEPRERDVADERRAGLRRRLLRSGARHSAQLYSGATARHGSPGY